MSYIGLSNITGCIMSKENELYTIGTTDGTISSKYTRNQFEICSSQILSLEEIPSCEIRKTEAIR